MHFTVLTPGSVAVATLNSIFLSIPESCCRCYCRSTCISNHAALKYYIHIRTKVSFLSSSLLSLFYFFGFMVQISSSFLFCSSQIKKAYPRFVKRRKEARIAQQKFLQQAREDSWESSKKNGAIMVKMNAVRQNEHC